MKLFADGLHQEFATWALGFAPYGGADVGEVVAIADAVEDGDDGSYYEAWTAMAGRLAAEADAAQSKGRRQSAREAYLHASCYYAIAYHPLYGTPVDPRLSAAFREQIGCFEKAWPSATRPSSGSRSRSSRRRCRPTWCGRLDTSRRLARS